MTLQTPSFQPFTISVVVPGVTYVASESDKTILHEAIAQAIAQAIKSLGQDHRVSIGNPGISVSWPPQGSQP